MKLKRLFSDKYILLFGVVAVLTFIVTSIMYKIHFFSVYANALRCQWILYVSPGDLCI